MNLALDTVILAETAVYTQSQLNYFDCAHSILPMFPGITALGLDSSEIVRSCLEGEKPETLHRHAEQALNAVKF